MDTMKITYTSNYQALTLNYSDDLGDALQNLMADPDSVDTWTTTQ